MDKLRFHKRIHGEKIYQNYVVKGSETSKGEQLLLPRFNGNLAHTPKCRFEQEFQRLGSQRLA